VPIKAYNLVRIVEHYYSPLRRIYYIIIAELPDINKDMALQIAFKAINDSIGPNSLIPTLLVFRAYLYIVESNAPNPTVIKRAVALKKAIKEVKKLRAKRQVIDALNMRNRPKITTIYNLPLNSPVLVWREGPIG
jgi:hypothetical protein